MRGLSRSLALVLVLVLVACGRIGFDERGDPADVTGDGGTSGPRDAFTPATCASGCNVGQYCGTDDGSCSAVGECLLISTLCSGAAPLVCGCDGVTYVNECEASAAGMSVATLGACPYVASCSESCGPDDYCATPVGMCAAQGTCMPRLGASCPDLVVCGCDGQSYGTACDARMAGMNLASLMGCSPI